MSDSPNGAKLIYTSASDAKPDAPVATPGSAAPKPAATTTTPAPSPAATPPAEKPSWKAPDGAPGSAAQPDAPAEPASLYVNPLKTMEEAVAATPLPPDAEAMFDMGDEGKQAREVVRSAFLSAGASKEEVSHVWSVAMEAARPDAKSTTADEAERELRALWPAAEFDKRLRRAQTMMRDVARKHPAVASEVRKLGLDNSARFIAAVEKAARRRGR